MIVNNDTIVTLALISAMIGMINLLIIGIQIIVALEYALLAKRVLCGTEKRACNSSGTLFFGAIF